ncbi:hypothetical protein [Mycolicibacterium komossense]|uniref:Serine/threonine protein kinase n=1 Tax=Mycolicibacterium komossense TaxID=1779 RepID=A0ABT3C851_9MYCO|nr:hypothetical protein [Mycolicibacterium komossense]MCV7225621.1 hypothetical protein [Mycolicibacterium komossense]
MNDSDGPDAQGGWHNQQSVVWSAGVAAVVLLGVLIYAVVQMASGPDRPSGPPPPLPTYQSASKTPESTSSSTTTSYPVPSVQTSQDFPGAVISPTDQPSTDVPAPDVPTTQTPTTIYNPYVTTTNPAAGHV